MICQFYKTDDRLYNSGRFQTLLLSTSRQMYIGQHFAKIKELKKLV